MKRRHYLISIIVVLCILQAESQAFPPPVADENSERVKISNSTKWQWDRNHYIPPVKTPQSPVDPMIWTESLLVSDSPSVSSTLSIFQQQQQPQHQQPNGNRRERRSLLIIQDAGAGAAEVEISEITSRVSRAYAKRWYESIYMDLWFSNQTALVVPLSCFHNLCVGALII